MEDETLFSLGYWIKSFPMRKLNPEDWVCGIYKRDDEEWYTLSAMDGFEDPFQARVWAIDWLLDHDSKFKEIYDTLQNKKETT